MAKYSFTNYYCHRFHDQKNKTRYINRNSGQANLTAKLLCTIIAVFYLLSSYNAIGT